MQLTRDNAKRQKSNWRWSEIPNARW